MRTPLVIAAALFLAVLPAPGHTDSAGGHVTSELPPHDASDPKAPAVDRSNLLASERFWPLQVALLAPWTPAGRTTPLRPEFPGVLIRVEPSGAALIDFGRDGRHEVPIERTDLLERANRVRRGELEKLGPNLLFSIGPRLLDSAAETPQPFEYSAAAKHRAFLLVFADPDGEPFEGLAASLAPLRERAGALTIVFPLGRHSDAEVRQELRRIGWKVPFLYDHLSDAYAGTLLPEGTSPPAVLLVTGEGRLLFESAWRAGVAERLARALDQALEQMLGGAQEDGSSTGSSDTDSMIPLSSRTRSFHGERSGRVAAYAVKSS